MRALPASAFLAFFSFAVAGCSQCGGPVAEGEGEGGAGEGEGEGEGEGGEGEGEGEGEGQGASPVVTIVAPANGDTFAQGASVQFSATAIDAEDGAIANADIAWSTDVEGPLGVGGTVQNALVVAGAHVVTCTATDSQGNVGSASITITVAPNQAPVVTIGAPADGSFFLPSTSITFTATANDAEDGALSNIVWTANGAALGAGASITTALPTLGDYTVVAAAADSAGVLGSATITIHIVDNLPPICTINEPLDGASLVAGDSLTASATCVDPDGVGAIPNAGFVWTSAPSGFAGVGQSITQAIVTPGTYDVTVCATDTVNAAVTGCNTVTVVVTPNLPPVVVINAPANGDVIPACQDVPLSCSASDPNGQNVTVAWLEGATVIAGTANATYTPSVSGAHTLTCRATDSVGAVTSANVSFSVSSPAVTIVHPADLQVFRPGADVPMIGSACSTENGVIVTDASYSWIADGNGALGSGRVLTVPANPPLLAAGVHTITLDVSDGLGNVGTSSITIFVNTPPVVTITSPSATTVTVDAAAPIAFTGTANDAEQGNLTAIAVWNDNTLGNFATGGSAGLTSMLVGKHVVTLSATDVAGETGTDTVTVFATPGGVPFSQLFTSSGLNATVNNIAFDAANNVLWLAATGPAGGLYKASLDLGTVTRFDNGNSDLPNNQIVDVAIMTDGNLIVGTLQDAAVECSPVDVTCQIPQVGNGGPVDAVAVLADGRTLRALPGDGLFLDNWATDQHQFFQRGDGGGDGLINEELRDITVDPVNGDVWIATANGASLLQPVAGPGVSPANASTFTDFRLGGGNNLRHIAIAPVSDDVWFATSNGVDWLERATGNVTAFRTADGLASNDVRDVAIDVVTVNGSGREIAWAATGGGLSRIDAGRSIVSITTADGAPSNDLRSVLVLADHTKVVGTTGGAFTYSGL